MCGKTARRDLRGGRRAIGVPTLIFRKMCDADGHEEIPPLPEGWNKTFEDLSREMESGTRTELASPELDWAFEYERKLIPEGSRFPKPGDSYRANRATVARFFTEHRSPVTGGGEAPILPGELFTIDCDPEEHEPIYVIARACDHSRVEARVVSAEERKLPTYSGFHFQLSTRELLIGFDLVSEAAN